MRPRRQETEAPVREEKRWKVALQHASQDLPFGMRGINTWDKIAIKDVES